MFLNILPAAKIDLRPPCISYCMANRTNPLFVAGKLPLRQQKRGLIKKLLQVKTALFTFGYLKKLTHLTRPKTQRAAKKQLREHRHKNSRVATMS